VYTPAQLADLEPSILEQGQLVPGSVCPLSPDQPGMWVCIEGNRRLAVCRRNGLPFWAFLLRQSMPEKDLIKLKFHYNGTRRVMSREEIAQGAARYMELTGCSAAEAARHLNISPATLSRALGERRIPPELRERAELIAPTIRSLVASAPPELMPQAVGFALTPRDDGKRTPSREQVAAFIQQLKKQGNGQAKGRKPRVIDLRINGRAVTLAIGERDSAGTVAEDLKALANGLIKHASVAPDGWPFLFQ
jgi:ParB/RepB/Spo0J family partition protein